MTVASSIHVPVMLAEVLDGLSPQSGGVFVDGTLGGGGHTRALTERVGPGGRIIALDRDPAAIEAAARNLADLPVRPVRANFCDLPEVLAEIGVETVDGILLDLGLSSDQLADQDRGFSFSSTGPLDLRFDPMQGKPAWRLLERLSAEHLADLIYQYGEERYSRRIARAIVQRRQRPAGGNGGRFGRVGASLCSPVAARPHRSGHADLPGLENRRERRAQVVGNRAPPLARLPAARGTAGGNQLPFAGGPPGERGLSRRSAADVVDAKADHPLGCGNRRESAISQCKTSRRGSQLTVGCRLHRRPE